MTAPFIISARASLIGPKLYLGCVSVISKFSPSWIQIRFQRKIEIGILDGPKLEENEEDSAELLN